jgi:phospholipase C
MFPTLSSQLQRARLGASLLNSQAQSLCLKQAFMGSNPIQHVFVLMLENRSFDHLLGFSGLQGMDAATGALTTINGLVGTESNTFNGQAFPVTPGALYRMPVDPGHEFANVLDQLAGPAAKYPNSGPYPPINNSGYVDSYVNSGGGGDPADLMRCFTAAQLPVLNALAGEFVVCDNWHASMPGPTWPNRMFVHAASSGGLDHSPTTPEILDWETLNGFRFANGTIFDTLALKGIKRCLYAGDDFPMVAALKGIQLGDIRQFSDFAGDLVGSSFPFSYVFIEPSYDVLNDYKSGTSQHPLADITQGEALIKATYEAIRNSAVWPSSLLIITWDEHGGFYDHAIPPSAVAPGDTAPNSQYNQSGFTFEQYGPRVPAIAISPLIPRNLIDHRLYDHSSIPATLEHLFTLNSMTARDATANSLTALVTLSAARQDAPATLPSPANSGAGVAHGLAMRQASASVPLTVSRPADTVNEGSLPAILQSALHQDLAVSPPVQRAAILERVRAIHTREQARAYMQEVRQKIAPLKVKR